MKKLLCILLVLLMLAPGAWAQQEEASGETFSFSSSEVILERDGLKIYGKLLLPDAEGPLPLVILSHGFGGNHTQMSAYAEAFARHGIAAYSFDFVGGGYGIKSDGTMQEMSPSLASEPVEKIVRPALRAKSPLPPIPFMIRLPMTWVEFTFP